jgi:hypothetical protein
MHRYLPAIYPDISILVVNQFPDIQDFAERYFSIPATATTIRYIAITTDNTYYTESYCG